MGDCSANRPALNSACLGLGAGLLDGEVPAWVGDRGDIGLVRVVLACRSARYGRVQRQSFEVGILLPPIDSRGFGLSDEADFVNDLASLLRSERASADSEDRIALEGEDVNG